MFSLNKLAGLLIFMSFFTNAGVLSVRDVDAKVILVDGLSTMWIEMANRSDFDKISKWSPIMSTRPDRKLIKIHLYGVEKIPREDFKSAEDKQYIMYSRLNTSLKNRNVTVNCYETTIKRGFPVCQVSVGGIDLSSNIISSGNSRFFKEDARTKSLNIDYKKMENIAKDREIGIWEPFYLLKKSLKDTSDKI